MGFFLLFELVYDFVEEGAFPFVLGAVLAHFIGKVEKGIFLVFVQPFRHGDVDFHVEVSFAGGLKVRHAFAGDAEAGAGLGAGAGLSPALIP